MEVAFESFTCSDAFQIGKLSRGSNSSANVIEVELDICIEKKGCADAIDISDFLINHQIKVIHTDYKVNSANGTVESSIGRYMTKMAYEFKEKAVF